MSAPAPPTIPPRPVKQLAAAQGVSKLPDIPPRPSKRMERSISPANYPGSPLNEPYNMTKPRDVVLPARPPSVHHLPAPGEEGMEYANIQYQPDIPASVLAQDAAAQKRTIAEDLQLHAPKPSLPKSSATAQVQGVTRTDSAAAASHGFGRSSENDLHMTRTRSRQSFSRPDSAASGERRRSMFMTDEHGPAELGLRVPINPLLGDVQAPTPQGMSPQVTGDSPRRHSRKRSGVEDFRPPDSYGLHGHGTIANTKFEREWYAKHPDQLEHEEGHGHGVYEGIGSGRGSYALSSDELNKIVRETASRGAGFGTKENISSFPDEQIGYMASETYQKSRETTPQPESLSRTTTRPSQPLESPLRRTSFPADDAPPAQVRRSRQSGSQSSDKAVADDDDAYHISEPSRKFNKVTGGQETQNETQEGKPYVTTDEGEDGHEHRVPILAEDEVAKDVGTEFLHPAVSPKFERRGSKQYDDEHGSGAHTPTSRPASRPGSIYQMHSASHSLSRFLSHQEHERDHMHTPLEDVAEYEPLFDDSEEKRAMTTAERFKRRPDILQKRFPSQDIWEDTPSSAMYVAEVSTPDLPSQLDESKQLGATTTSTFEHPDVDHARKGEVPESEKKKLVDKDERLAKSKFAPHLRDDMPTNSRPTLAGRFPSQDVWEDTPDSSYLVTTVGGPQEEEETSPVDTKPPVPTRPAKSRLGEGASSDQLEPSVAPQIPARPPKRLHQVPPADAKLTGAIPLSQNFELKKTPSIPDRPKPKIPPRPARKPDEEHLTRVTSGGSNESTDTQVPASSKPQVPARPAGGNFAGLKGNFMSDLNKKLGLGPPKEKEPEPEAEPKVLEDARKSRARGPQRRAPAKQAATEPPKATHSFAMFTARSIWQINDHDELSTITEEKEEPEPVAVIDHAEKSAEPAKAEQVLAQRPEDAPAPLASGLSTNTAGEPTDPVAAGDSENLEGELTRKSTATTISGDDLDREYSREQTHMLPVSQFSTAEDSAPEVEKGGLEKLPSKEMPGSFEVAEEQERKAEEEPIKVRNEQVSAAKPDSDDTHRSTDSVRQTDPDASAEQESTGSGDAPGSDAPKEPMNEADVNYDKLEEMTAKADGKMTAEEDPQAEFGMRKVVD